MATLGRLMSLLSPFDVVIWMTDGWPLYESRKKKKMKERRKRETKGAEKQPRAHETVLDLVCRLLLEKKKKN